MGNVASGLARFELGPLKNMFDLYPSQPDRGGRYIGKLESSQLIMLVPRGSNFRNDTKLA